MKKKKGFTLVELLVVIAILAVLATVSVVGYMGFTKKAHESNDIGLTTQMNTILQAEEVTNKPSTPHEAVKQLANGGVDVEKLTPTTDGYNYVYDLDTNRMFLLNTDKQPVAPTNINYTKENRIFAIVGNESEYNTWKEYNVYLKTNFEMTSTNLFADLKTGLDVGSNKIDNITYTGSSKKEALIRTNGGTLTINAGADTVYHYGASDYVNVIAINTNSYHEFGASAYARIASGHFVVESSAKIVNLNIASSSVTVTEESGSSVGAYSKSEENVTVTVNGTTKEVDDVKSEDDIKNVVNNSEVVAEGGVAEINGIGVKTLQSAIDMSIGGETIKLIKNIETEKTIYLNKSINFDLNGFSLYNDKVSLDQVDGNVALLSIYGSIDVVLKDSSASKKGSIVVKENDAYCINIGKCANVVVESGTYIGNVSTIQIDVGSLTVLGGNFDLRQIWPAKGNGYEYEINCIDSNYKKGNATASIKGGTFTGFDPSNNEAEGKGTSFLADGYKVVSVKHPTNPNININTVVKE